MTYAQKYPKTIVKRIAVMSTKLAERDARKLRIAGLVQAVDAAQARYDECMARQNVAILAEFSDFNDLDKGYEKAEYERMDAITEHIRAEYGTGVWEAIREAEDALIRAAKESAIAEYRELPPRRRPASLDMVTTPFDAAIERPWLADIRKKVLALIRERFAK